MKIAKFAGTFGCSRKAGEGAKFAEIFSRGINTQIFEKNCRNWAAGREQEKPQWEPCLFACSSCAMDDGDCESRHERAPIEGQHAHRHCRSCMAMRDCPWPSHS
eukprot:scaffold62572_cov79-Phaeocystis_antarctica.AAC.1